MSAMIPAWVGGRLQPVEKLEVHLRGLKHKAVSVFVTSGEFVLLQQRALGKYHTPGLWANTCCTHPNWREDSATCATRRLDEELGISGLRLRWRDQVEYRAVVGDAMVEHEVVDIFVAEMDRHQPFVPNPHEVMQVQWVRRSELTRIIAAQPALFTPWFKIYVADFAAQIFDTAPSGQTEMKKANVLPKAGPVESSEAEQGTLS